jgi:hypothetical protein
MRIHFVLITEGPSDDGLIPHLENLCIEAGADEVTGTAPDFRRLPYPVGQSVIDKIRESIRLEPQANLLIIHRDADNRDPQPRLSEIEQAAHRCALSTQWVALVPVQETEAWLLLDEKAIRLVANKPNGQIPLHLPKPQHVENIARPKEFLQQVLVAASETKGKKLDKFRRQFSSQRRILLLRLPINGPLLSVSSWMRTRDAVVQAIDALKTARQEKAEKG